ncbi:enoyl-CoA hydratase-related protein [Amycolatopsis sp. SID8362]|uniref:enoyl-CoA hydratase-related protein n=1 Tax=Amycolatopsis sp. SID8362 TaxID=2690346 RepID=UPI001370F7CB|nr:enoyl-CoA hydratase-related protein [Amycolatopsis sp. SID8362]NBH06520.1 hypothetical protein [Amycolatopsis sp. SID8362]NED43217.1 hypothetical protein [Amycolatopsis sp. SID8362]
MLDLHYRRGVVVVRFRPDPELLDRLGAALAYIGSQRSIVLTGTGTVFAPDLATGDGLRPAEVLDALRAHPLPVVAAINGDAIGTGWALAEAADVRVMSGGVIQPDAAEAAVCYRVRAALATGLVEYATTPANLLTDAMTLAGRLEPQVVAAG